MLDYIYPNIRIVINQEGVEDMEASIVKLNIAQARAQMSNRELQQKAGISDVTLAKIRSGSYQARPLTIGKLAAALGVDVTEIIELEART